MALNKRPYQFKKKGNKAQFLFNERIEAAKRQLNLVPTTDDVTKQVLKRTVGELDQGKEAIRVRQKHIWIADRSDWGVMAEYEADELASDSDDEKKLYRARKEREKEREAKKWRATATLKKKPRQEGATRRLDSQTAVEERDLLQQKQSRLGPVTPVQGGAIWLPYLRRVNNNNCILLSLCSKWA